MAGAVTTQGLCSGMLDQGTFVAESFVVYIKIYSEAKREIPSKDVTAVEERLMLLRTRYFQGLGWVWCVVSEWFYVKVEVGVGYRT